VPQEEALPNLFDYAPHQSQIRRFSASWSVADFASRHTRVRVLFALSSSDSSQRCFPAYWSMLLPFLSHPEDAQYSHGHNDQCRDQHTDSLL